MKKDIITHINKCKLFDEIDRKIAAFLGRRDGLVDTHVFLAAALVSRAARSGDVCLNLAAWGGAVLRDESGTAPEAVCPSLADWRRGLQASRVVGAPGAYTPLILDARDRLYLQRFWCYEQQVAAAVATRSQGMDGAANAQNLGDSLQRLFAGPNGERNAEQLLAAVAALCHRLCIISGGPGTGKTFTVAKIIALHLEQGRGAGGRILLAAPTGKAAARLTEAVKTATKTLDVPAAILDAFPPEAVTLHRLLRASARPPYFRYNQKNRLPADVVIIDEASMVDLPMMAKVVQALEPDARLVLVGDKDQLASVAAGSVLSDLCGPPRPQSFSPAFTRQIQALTGLEVPVNPSSRGPLASLADSTVYLEKSYRFPESGAIRAFSRLVNAGDAAGAARFLETVEDPGLNWRPFTSTPQMYAALAKKIRESYTELLAARDPHAALAGLNRFRILCVLRQGPWGVEALNALTERVLRAAGLIAFAPGENHTFFSGKPLMILRNSYALQVYNGDLGVILPGSGSAGELACHFTDAAGGIRSIHPARLPTHESAWAMTVHKSQGSEFDEVLLVLPERDTPLLTKEVVYTGITRARRRISIWGSTESVRRAVARRIERVSGLRDALWI